MPGADKPAIAGHRGTLMLAAGESANTSQQRASMAGMVMWSAGILLTGDIRLIDDIESLLRARNAPANVP